MLKKLSTVIVLVAVCSLMVSTHKIALGQTAGDTAQTEEIRQKVAALREGARVSVKLRDKKKVTGHINYVGDQFFTMTDVKTQASLKLAYSDVTQIERKNKGFSRGGKIALGIVGVLFVMSLIANGGGG